MTSIDRRGGMMASLIPDEAIRAERLTASTQFRTVTLNTKQLCDLELLLSGGFAPLEGYLGSDDHASVLEQMRLGDGTLWPIPITLDLDAQTQAAIGPSETLTLCDKEGNPLAMLEVSEIYEIDRRREARAVFGTDDPRHPGVLQLLESGPCYVAGKLVGIQLPRHFDFTRFRHTPDGLRQLFAEHGWQRIIAFQTRNPLHRAHEALVARAMASCEAKLLLHPVVGLTQPGDLDYAVRVQSYRNVVARLGAANALLSLLPLAMRMAGPREALWHAMIRKNYGCTHFLVASDHAGPGPLSERRRFYEPGAAQRLALAHADEIGIEIVPARTFLHVPSRNVYLPAEEVPENEPANPVTSIDLRDRLGAGEAIPAWLMHPDDVDMLRRAFPPKSAQGFTVFFTGLSGAGKSTVAKALFSALQELGRPITLLDGDVVRLHLSKGLGFSKEDRDTNILRIGYVASLITKHRGIAICAPIAPYRATRRKVREMVAGYGGFVEVHVATPLEVCESRDPKGLYAKARAGKISLMTGIDDPYEEPELPELRLDTSQLSVIASVDAVWTWLEDAGYLPKRNDQEGWEP